MEMPLSLVFPTRLFVSPEVEIRENNFVLFMYFGFTFTTTIKISGLQFLVFVVFPVVPFISFV